MRALALLLACSSLSLTACSGSTSSVGGSPDGGDGGGGGQSVEQVTAALAAAYCARIQACAPTYATVGFGTISNCQTRFATLVQDDLAAEGTSLTLTQAETCTGQIPDASCGDLLGNDLPAGCQTLPGKLANGAACGTDSQCEGTRCRVPADAVCGVCTTPSPAGAQCDADGDCQSGMTCVSSVCTAYGGPGASCSSAAPCRPDLGCVGGTCGTPSPAGAACTGSGQCDELHGVYCLDTTGTSTCQTVSFAAAGAPCGLIGGTYVGCAGPGGYCKGVMAPAYQGTCLAYAPDGKSCDTDAGPLCDYAAVCAGGTCQLPDPSTCM